MTERPTFGDPLSAPFWAAAAEHRLMLQRCEDCAHHQFYPRPFCLACDGQVAWVEASGNGTVHSQTTVHLPISPHLQPPYVVAIVQLDEGPRLTANIVGGHTAIDDRVTVSWLERDDAPPLPVFTPGGPR